MSDPKQVRALLEAAERDISAIRGMGDSAVFADEIFGFHVQQSAEKLLKAWLASLGETYPLSHDLATLLDMLGSRGADVVRFDDLVDFTRYAAACVTQVPIRARIRSTAARPSNMWRPCLKPSDGNIWARRNDDDGGHERKHRGPGT